MEAYTLTVFFLFFVLGCATNEQKVSFLSSEKLLLFEGHRRSLEIAAQCGGVLAWKEMAKNSSIGHIMYETFLRSPSALIASYSLHLGLDCQELLALQKRLKTKVETTKGALDDCVEDVLPILRPGDMVR